MIQESVFYSGYRFNGGSLFVLGKQPSEYQDLTVRNRGLQILGNGTLVIRQAQPEHQGQYMCEVSNGIGAGLSTVIFLTVHSKQLPYVILQLRLNC